MHCSLQGESSNCAFTPWPATVILLHRFQTLLWPMLMHLSVSRWACDGRRQIEQAVVWIIGDCWPYLGWWCGCTWRNETLVQCNPQADSTSWNHGLADEWRVHDMRTWQHLVEKLVCIAHLRTHHAYCLQIRTHVTKSTIMWEWRFPKYNLAFWLWFAFVHSKSYRLMVAQCYLRSST